MNPTPEQIEDWEKMKLEKQLRDKFGECWLDKPGRINPNSFTACNAPVESDIGLCGDHYRDLAGRDVSEAIPPKPHPFRTKEGYWVDG